MHQFQRWRRALAAIGVAALAAQWVAPSWAQTSAPAVPATTAPATTDSLATAAPAPSNAAPAVPDSLALEQSRQFVRSGDYDQAIDGLKTLIGQEKRRVPVLREAYLLLIRTYVFVGNDLEGKPNGREQAKLSYREASGWIAECLKIKELRHTQPDPESDPPKMVELFAEQRARMFGSFSVSSVTPSSSVVLLDADTLRVRPGAKTLGDVDLTVGRHVVLARSAGFSDLSEEISIQPASVLVRSYQLKRKHGALWYAGGAVVATGVTWAVIELTKSNPTEEQPLPGAPPPPSQ